MSGPNFPPPLNANDYVNTANGIRRRDIPTGGPVRGNNDSPNRPQQSPNQAQPAQPPANPPAPAYNGSQFPSAQQRPSELIFPSPPPKEMNNQVNKQELNRVNNQQELKPINRQELNPVNNQEAPVNKQELKPINKQELKQHPNAPQGPRHKTEGPGFTTKDGINFPGGVVNNLGVPPSSTKEVALQRLKDAFEQRPVLTPPIPPRQ